MPTIGYLPSYRMDLQWYAGVCVGEYADGIQYAVVVETRNDY